jgi:hypothetical protein
MSAAEADAAQERINRDAKRDYFNHPMEERAKMDVPSAYAATGVNESGMDLIGGFQQVDKQRVKTHGEREDAFVREVTEKAVVKRQVNGKGADVNTTTLKSEAREAFQKWVQDNDGALPKPEDAEKMMNRLVQNQLVPGRIYGTNEKPQWKIDADAKKKPAPAGKPSAAERAKQLKAEGKNLADIAKTLNSEGY